LVIHYGEPIYEGERGHDWSLSLTFLQQFPRQGLTSLGLYLGENAREQQKFDKLLPHMVVCAGKDLTPKLGQMLHNLA
jgi:hypothetical protein